MKIKMTHDRETKGTHVYRNSDEGAAIPSLYIKKSAFGSKPPLDVITIEIKEL